MFSSLLSDRCRTTNNMLGDAYGAAVVEALSKKELQETAGGKDQHEEAKLDEEALIGLYKTPSTESSNGSSVKVREVREYLPLTDLRSSLFQEIFTDTSNSDED